MACRRSRPLGHRASRKGQAAEPRHDQGPGRTTGAVMTRTGGQRGGGRKRFLTWQGKQYQPVELAEIAGITPKTMISRINRNGVDRAMSMVLQIMASRDET